MAKTRYDVLIEAVRYTTDGQIEFARVYERRGAAFSDQFLMRRNELIARLKKGEKFVTGSRKSFLAGTFETGKDVLLVTAGSGEVVATQSAASRDMLETVPLL